jgi:hypothetical protein
MRKDNMGIGTLRWWAKQDNLVKYVSILDESILPKIDQSVASDGAHFDIACVVHSLFKEEFKSQQLKSHRWKLSYPLEMLTRMKYPRKRRYYGLIDQV